MNILIINHYAGTPEMGMEFRPYYFAREWVKMGHKVYIIAGDYSHLRRINPCVEKDFQKELIDGINYHWIKTGKYEGNGVKRALTMGRFVAKIWFHSNKIIREMNPDVIITSSTYPIDTYAGQRIKSKSQKKVRLIHEVHDMWPATLIEVGGMSPKNPFVTVMQMGENSAYRNSDKVVSLPPLAKDYMVEHGMTPDKFVEIPNGIVVDDWENPIALPKKHFDILTELRKDGKFIVGYFGGHALSNSLDTLLDCAERISDDDIHFVLVGDGVKKKELLQNAEDRQLKNITFLDSIEKNAIPSLGEFFDVTYFGAKRSPLYRFGISMNKMVDALMIGKPIVCAVTTPKSAISEYSCGIVVNSMDVLGIIDAIKYIKEMTQQEMNEMKKRSRHLARQKYSYERLGRKFETLFH